MEALHFLRYRYIFTSGIYELDLSEIQNFDHVNDILNDYSKKVMYSSSKEADNGQHSHHSSSNQTTITQMQRRHSLQLVDEASDYSDQKDGLLLIFDKSDDFVRRNKASFKANLNFVTQKFQNITIIFISQQKLDDSFQFQSLKVQPLSEDVARHFLHTTTKGRQDDLNYAKIIELANGNPIMLRILNMLDQISIEKGEAGKRIVNLIDKV